MSSLDNSNAVLIPCPTSPAIPSNVSLVEFCIIESREGAKDFERLQLTEIEGNITARKDKIFLLMEEVRRLRIQQRIKGGGTSAAKEVEREEFPSSLPFLPPLTEKTLTNYYTFYIAFLVAIIMFGGILAPMLEFKLGLGGTSYSEFIQSVHLPSQLAEVDPIVASFCGGAVGVLSALLVVELNGVTRQQHNRCLYCQGTGYLLCGSCAGQSSSSELALALTGVGGNVCSTCSGMGKVMCTGCLCTGKTMATEHDPRIDPFV
eukprot:gene17885-24277_t